MAATPRRVKNQALLDHAVDVAVANLRRGQRQARKNIRAAIAAGTPPTVAEVRSTAFTLRRLYGIVEFRAGKAEDYRNGGRG